MHAWVKLVTAAVVKLELRSPAVRLSPVISSGQIQDRNTEQFPPDWAITDEMLTGPMLSAILSKTAKTRREVLDMTITPFRPIPPLSERDKERFWSRVTKTDTCWLWNGATRPGTGHQLAYGSFTLTFAVPPYGRVTGVFSAHRIAYVIANGQIPPELQILHSCDNPGCVNPDHLRTGTFAENMADKILRNRVPRGPRTLGVRQPRIECKPKKQIERRKPTLSKFNQKLTDDQVVAIRTRYAEDARMTLRELARLNAVCTPTVAAIVTGKSRKGAGGPISQVRKILGEKVVVRPASGRPARRTQPEHIQTIRILYARGPMTIYDLARQFSISPQTVSKIIRHEHWKHISDPPEMASLPLRGFTKLTREQVTKIRQRYAAGTPQHKLAVDYKVSRSTISMLVNRKTHR